MSHDHVEFAEFWDRYPRRIGKLAAERAYTKARRLCSAADILTGVENYIDTKPTWQAWAHPSSWLNAGRWMDDVKSERRASAWACPHTPAHNGRHDCYVFTALEKARREKTA